MENSVKTNIGIIGCGQISSIYLESPRTFDILNIVACADIDLARAQSQTQRFNVPKACSVAELLADPGIDIVINLTIPRVHAEIDLAIIEAGKSPYSEKPLGLNREQGSAVLASAASKNLHVGCAPDTFLGAGIQSCIKLINDGTVGEPVGATAFMMSHGTESWHADPDFFYQPGAGPLFDMGPYYLTALIAMLGPVKRVSGSTRITFPERLITSQPKYGTTIKVNTPTHIAGNLDFANGAIATMIMSFDVWSHQLPRIEIYGTEGTLVVPDPNTFGGPIHLRRAHEKEWREMPLTHRYENNSRGIGVADMADAIKTGRPHRANGELAYHVLDIMQSLLESSEQGQHIVLGSTCKRPASLTPGIHDWREES